MINTTITKQDLRAIAKYTSLILAGVVLADNAIADNEFFGNLTTKSEGLKAFMSDTVRPILVAGIGIATAYGVGFQSQNLWARGGAAIAASGLAYYLTELFT